MQKEDRQLEQAARQAEGVVRSRHARGLCGSRCLGTVLVTAATTGYMDFLRNWVCRAEALHLRYLMIALDRPLYLAYTKGFDRYSEVPYPVVGPGATIALYDVERRRNLTTGTVSGTFHRWRAHNFNDVSVGKILAVGGLLAAGLNVLFIDADVGILQAPIPMIPMDSFVHYAYQADLNPRPEASCTDMGGGVGNTGVYWARNSPPMIKWFLGLDQEFLSARHIDDQENFWNIFNQKKLDIPLKLGTSCALPPHELPKEPYICALSPCITPNGWVQLDPTPARLLTLLKRPPLLVHPNFVLGGDAKRYMLRNLSLWVVDDPDHCNQDKQRTLDRMWWPKGR